MMLGLHSAAPVVCTVRVVMPRVTTQECTHWVAVRLKLTASGTDMLTKRHFCDTS